MRPWAVFFAGFTIACAGRAPSVGVGAGAVTGRACDGGCPHDAACGAAGLCACAAGLVVLDGACVAPEDARRYCGIAARWSGEGCVVRACPPGEPLDATTGACVPSRSLREIAARDHLILDPDQTLGCHEGHTLIVSAGHPACLPNALICARGARWSGASCAAEPSCPAGELMEGSSCRPLALRGAAGDAYTIDVSRWAAIVLGADGGAGGERLCRPLEASPRVLGAGPAMVTHVVVTIELIFPNNDVTQVAARVDARDEATAKPLPPEAADLTSRALAPLVQGLRAFGGTSSSASLSTRVRCVIAGGAPPMSVPRTEHASSTR
jgi:hypothetical protein